MPPPTANDSNPPLGAARVAVDMVEDGMSLGLGTGRAASAFVEVLGARVADGLNVTGVATSEATADLARGLGIPLAQLDDVDHLDITFDGADEVDANLDLIKGYGAAMVREKIVARRSKRLVILVGPEKKVGVLGERGRLPIEVIPFAAGLLRESLGTIGLDAAIRPGEDGSPVITDNGHWVCDAKLVPPLPVDPDELERRLVALPGVLGTGLFLRMADVVLIGDGEDVETLRREG